MLKSDIVLLYALLCTSVLSDKFALKQTNFTREWSIRTYNPAVLKLNNQLLTVTKSNVSINVTPTDHSFKSCHIPVDPETDRVLSRLRAKALGNGKVVVWGFNSTLYAKEGSRTVNYVVFVIDPRSCSTKRLPTLTDEVPANWIQFWGSLVTYQDSFDIFFPTQKICSPCRFSDNGDKIQLTYSLNLNEEGARRSYNIDTMEEYNPSMGYFYTTHLQNGLAKLLVLNEKFEETDSEEFWTHWLDSNSVVKGNTGYCLIDDMVPDSNYDDSADCSLMDRKQNSTAGSATLQLPGDGPATHSAISILEDGSAWVAVAYSQPKPQPAQIYVVKMKPVNVTGLSRTDASFAKAEVSEHVDFQRISDNYLLEMEGIVLGEEFCLVTVERKKLPEDYEKPEFNLTVKCMTASE